MKFEYRGTHIVPHEDEHLYREGDFEFEEFDLESEYGSEEDFDLDYEDDEDQ